jgi:hypothetical protein
MDFDDAQAWERQMLEEQWAECQRSRRAQYENPPDGDDWWELEHPRS